MYDLFGERTDSPFFIIYFKSLIVRSLRGCPQDYPLCTPITCVICQDKRHHNDIGFGFTFDGMAQVRGDMVGKEGQAALNIAVSVDI